MRKIIFNGMPGGGGTLWTVKVSHIKTWDTFTVPNVPLTIFIVCNNIFFRKFSMMHRTRIVYLLSTKGM